MSVQDDLKSAKKKLERSQEHWEEQSQKWEERIAASAVKEKLQEQFDEMKTFHEQFVAGVNEEIQRLESEINEQVAIERQAARAELKKLKADRLDKWLLSGGTAEGFADVWPQMEQDILRERTLAALKPSTVTTSKKQAGTSPLQQGSSRVSKELIAKKRNRLKIGL